MSSPVYCQLIASSKTFVTFRALVRARVNIHVFLQGMLRCKTFLTVRTTTGAICRLTTGVNIQMSSRRKLSVKHSAQVCLMWTPSHITAVGFSCSLQTRAPVSDIIISLKHVIPCTTPQDTLLLLLLLYPFNGVDGILGRSGISWTMCKQSAPDTTQITKPTPRHSIFTGRLLFLTPSQQCQSTRGMTQLYK